MQPGTRSLVGRTATIRANIAVVGRENKNRRAVKRLPAQNSRIRDRLIKTTTLSRRLDKSTAGEASNTKKGKVYVTRGGSPVSPTVQCGLI